MERRIFLPGRMKLSLSITMIMLLCLSAGAFAASNDTYYEGKAITIIVPAGTGGGTDIWARVLAKYIGEFIPGKPNVVVRNMPGAGSLIGANHAYRAKPDGFTCLMTNQTTIMNNFLRPKGTEHELGNMIPVYASPQGSAFVAKTYLFNEPKEVMKTKDLVFGHMPATGGTTSIFVWTKQLIGFPAKRMVLGYSGSGDARLAFISDESNVTGGSTSAIVALKPYIEKGEAVPFFQGGILDADGNVVVEPAFPNFLTSVELYRQIHKKEPSGKEYEVLKAVLGAATYNKSILLPPGVPKYIVEILSKAVIEMTKDPKFIEETEKLNPGGVHFVGDELRGFAKGVSAPEEIVDFMKETLTKEYGVRF